MADMLRMPARQIGNPITNFVLMESDDFLLQLKDARVNELREY
jgi:hypothetical protein